jgi:hypothetical protein
MDSTGQQHSWPRGQATVLVQDPPVKGYFNSHDLNWIDDVAYIKSDRLEDFVEGEAACYEEARLVVLCSLPMSIWYHG